MSDVLQLQKTQADIANTQSLTQFRNVETQKTQEAADVAAASRQAMRNAEQAKTQAPALIAGTGDAQPAQGVNGNADVMSINQNIAQLTNDYKNHSNMASAIRNAGGDPTLADKFDDNATHSQQALAVEQLRLLEAKKNVSQQSAAVAASANADNWKETKSQLDSLVPGWDKGQDVDFDPLAGGQVTWSDRTAKVVDALGKAGQTSYQQAEVAHSALQDSVAAKRLALDQDKETREQGQADSQDALRRARIADLAAKNEARTNPKTTAVKPPTMHEISDLAPDIATDTGLPLDAAKLMAGDVLRRRNELTAKNPEMSIEDATDQANEEAKARVQAGATAPWYKPFTANLPATYARVGKGAPATATLPSASGDDAQTQAVSVLTPLTKVGVAAKMEGGKLTAPDGSPLKITSREQAQALPPGTQFIGPDGQLRVRK